MFLSSPSSAVFFDGMGDPDNNEPSARGPLPFVGNNRLSGPMPGVLFCHLVRELQMIHKFIFTIESLCVGVSWAACINAIELGHTVAFPMASEIALSLESLAATRTGESILS